MIGTRSSFPWAAKVAAALRVVSPGKIGMTASRAMRRKIMKYENAAFSGSMGSRPSLFAM